MVPRARQARQGPRARPSGAGGVPERSGSRQGGFTSAGIRDQGCRADGRASRTAPGTLSSPCCSRDVLLAAASGLMRRGSRSSRRKARGQPGPAGGRRLRLPQLPSRPGSGGQGGAPPCPEPP